jgi:pentatricopeptide repeat protein
MRSKCCRDDFAYVSLLKACAERRDLDGGARLHADISRKGSIATSAHLASSLIHMYVKCGVLAPAQRVLDALLVRDVVSWTALIAGYVQQGRGNEALRQFERMKGEGISPNAISFTSVLKACGSMQSLSKGKHVHEEIISSGLAAKDAVLGSALVDMYTKCGALAEARKVLSELPNPNVVCWSTLIAGYAQAGRGREALDAFEEMQSKGLAPDGIAFSCALKACSLSEDLHKGKRIHRAILNTCFLDKDVVLGAALVDMYVKCGVLRQAHEVLEGLPVRDVVTWNTLVMGYSQCEQFHESWGCFECMQIEGMIPDMVSFLGVLKACCGTAGAIEKGRKIHRMVADRGLLEKSLVLRTALVDMYVKCGELVKAKETLHELRARDVGCWNSILAGCTQRGLCHEALECFRQMESEGVSPDEFTFSCILTACGRMGDLKKGLKIGEKVRGTVLRENVVLGTALVSMYAKCGMLAKAREVLEELCSQDAISWAVLISGYVEHGRFHEASNSFERMKSKGLSPNASTFACMLQACGSIGAVDKGERIHRDVVDRGLLRKDVRIGNALVDMYAKCGELVRAWELLEELPIRDTVSWSALISGHAQWGRGREAMNCFDQMQSEGIAPNDITFLSLLNACSHSGLMHQAQMLFVDMHARHDIAPSLEHQTCMIVGFASAGRMDEASSIIESMPSSDYPVVWRALLSACRKWGCREC